MTKAEADIESLLLLRRDRVKSSVVFCATCDAYHLTSPVKFASFFPSRMRKIIALAALGFTNAEIALDVGATTRIIEHELGNARLLLGAMSTAHLCVLATCFGLIDPFRLLPQITEDCHANQRATGS